MRWGKHKASSHYTPPKPHPSFLANVFPISLISKSKQRNTSSKHVSAKAGEKGRREFPSLVSSPGVRLREGRFYIGDDNSYWRLSFGEEDSVWHAFNEDLKGSRRGESSKTQELVCDEGQTRIVQPKMSFPLKNYAVRRNKVREGPELKRARRQPVKVKHFGNLGSRTLEQKRAERDEEKLSTKSGDKVIVEVQPERIIQCRQDLFKARASNSEEQYTFPFPNSKLQEIEEDCRFKTVNLKATHEQGEEKLCLRCKISEDMKITRSRTDSKKVQQRKSVYINRDSRRKRRKLAGRIKSYSPRTAVKIECKIKPLEDMKKVKMIKKNKNEGGLADTTKERAVSAKEKAFGDIRKFDSYAMIKDSHNPQQDYRESMIEMIIEEGIERPEELEELLACYLTLNNDEHHDLIVKIFREVWLELDEAHLTYTSQSDCFDEYWPII